MQRWLLGALWVVMAAGGMAGQAASRERPAAAVAARIDGEPLYDFSVQVMLRRAQQKDPASTAASVTETLIVNRLLARQARATLGAAELDGASRVGFAPDVALDDQSCAMLLNLYRKQIEAAIQALPGASVDGLIAQETRPAAASLDKIFGDQRKVTLEFALDAAQTALAKRLTLLRVKGAPGTDQDISFYEVYRRQNVQGRLEFHNRNLDFVQQQARLALRSRFLLAWAEARFGAQAMHDLRRTLSDQDQVHALMLFYGIAADAEGPGKMQLALAAQVSATEIARYYHAHPDQFKQTLKVKARHIRVASEAKANSVVALAAGGADFADLARTFSIAPDAANGGDLGWIAYGATVDWLPALAFLQAQGSVSKPYRAAVSDKEAANWEIVLTERRVEGLQALDSETVRYGAGAAIAAEKAARQFQALRQRLLGDAKIERLAVAGPGVAGARQ